MFRIAVMELWPDCGVVFSIARLEIPSGFDGWIQSEFLEGSLCTVGPILHHAIVKRPVDCQFRRC